MKEIKIKGDFLEEFIEQMKKNLPCDWKFAGKKTMR